MRELTGHAPLATLALTDAEIDATARAKMDAFVHAIRTGTPRRRVARRPQHATA
jgi:hypothetical protein